MKKMQCEVCGSVSIRKIDDNTFECQSCGIQYSKEYAKELLIEVDDTPTSCPRNKNTLNCSVYLEGFTVDITDETITKPPKDKLKALFTTITAHPYDCVLHIKSLSSISRFSEVEFVGSDYDGVVSVSLKNDEIIEEGLFYESDALELANTFAETGICDFSKHIQFKLPEPPKTKNAEKWINLFGIMGLTPYTFFLGIFTLCFINKAKDENDGQLSKMAKKGLKRGIIGFSIYVAIILIFIIVISTL